MKNPKIVHVVTIKPRPAIDKARTRKELPARREPYWAAPLASGQHIGFRKGQAGQDFWIARLTADRDRRYEALGIATDAFGWEQAKAAAVAWFKQVADGSADRPTNDIVTVADGCNFYIDWLESHGRWDAANDARLKLTAKVIDNDLGKKRVATVHSDHFDVWRRELALSAATFNRIVTPLRAALNLLVKKEKCEESRAIQWKKIESMPMPKNDKKNRRKSALDHAQRSALLAHCGEGAFRDLVEGGILTGARGGELASAKVSQFDLRTLTMDFSGKTGERLIPIPKNTTVLFQRLTNGRHADEYLFKCTERWSIQQQCRVPCEPTITHNDGTSAPRIWEAKEWGKMFRAAADKAGLSKKVVFTTLRHTWITEMLTNTNMSLMTAAQLTGTSLKMIQEHYGHLKSEVAREEMEKVQLL